MPATPREWQKASKLAAFGGDQRFGAGQLQGEEKTRSLEDGPQHPVARFGLTGSHHGATAAGEGAGDIKERRRAAEDGSL